LRINRAKELLDEVTGHAAGVAAAVAAQDGCRPRDVEVPKVQKILRQQDAYLG